MIEPIVCKPTPWFLLRAAAMILMFGIFAVLFFKDGMWGYRDKNHSYYVWQGIKAAADDFTAKKDSMDADQWKAYAMTQEIALPEDRSILPAGLPDPMPWPEVLGDYEAMTAGMSNQKVELFDKNMETLGLSYSAPEHDFDAGKIREQLIIAGICLVLTLISVVLLLRTLTRKMVLDGDTFQPAGGKAVAVSDLFRLDLRRWVGKGLAFAWAKTEGEEDRKIRIDGLTYGGFKKEDGEPAEKLMQGLKAGFSGEIIDYEPDEEDSEEASDAEA